MSQTQAESQNAPTLVAIAIAARKCGDRELERFARNQLRTKHGVKLGFAAESCQKTREDAADDR